jgi:hypothetical protein
MTRQGKKLVTFQPLNECTMVHRHHKPKHGLFLSCNVQPLIECAFIQGKNFNHVLTHNVQPLKECNFVYRYPETKPGLFLSCKVQPLNESTFVHRHPEAWFIFYHATSYL